MKILVTFLMIACFSSIATASKLAPLQISSLQQSSGLIVIGKIKSVVLLHDNGLNGKSYKVQITTISTLKGSENVKDINLTFHQGGLKGFNIIPKANSIWTVFLNKTTANGWKLVHPKSMAKFNSHFAE